MTRWMKRREKMFPKLTEGIMDSDVLIDSDKKASGDDSGKHSKATAMGSKTSPGNVLIGDPEDSSDSRATAPMSANQNTRRVMRDLRLTKRKEKWEDVRLSNVNDGV